MTSAENTVSISIAVRDAGTAAALDTVVRNVERVATAAETSAAGSTSSFERVDTAIRGTATQMGTLPTAMSAVNTEMQGPIDRFIASGRLAGEEFSAGMNAGVARAGAGAAAAAEMHGAQAGSRFGNAAGNAARPDLAEPTRRAGAAAETAAAESGGRAGTSLGQKMMSGLMAVGLLAGVGKIVNSSVDAAMGAAVDANKTARLTGGSVADSSQLNAEMMLSGVATDKGTVALQKFSKSLGSVQGDAKKTAAMTQELGFAFTDSSGQVLPLTQLMGPLSDKFKEMPNGAEKTALAMKIFGKSGTDMIPMLNKGSAGLADMAKKSDELGLTMSTKQIQAMADAKAAAREYEGSIQGLKIALGSALLPIMTAVHKFLEGFLIPVFERGVKILSEGGAIIGRAWHLLMTGEDTGAAGAPDSPLVKALEAGHAKFVQVKDGLTSAWKVLTMTSGDFAAASAGIGGPESPLTQALLGAHDKFEALKPDIEAAWNSLRTGDNYGVGSADESPLVKIALQLRDFGLGVFEKLRGIWDTLWQVGEGLWPSIKSLAESFGEIWTKVMDLFNPIAGLLGWWNLLLTAVQWFASLLTVTLVPALSWFAGFVKDNLPMIGFLVGAFVAWRVALMAISVWQEIVRISTLAWAAAQAVLTAVMDANPLTLIIIAIVALVAGIIYAYEHVDWFRNGIQFLWDIIQNVWMWISGNAHLVSDAFMWLWNAASPIFDFFKSSWDNFLQIIQGVWDIVAGLFTGDWSRLWEGVKEVFSGVWDQIINYLSTIWDILSGLGGKLLGWGAALMGWILGGIEQGAVDVWAWFSNLPDALWGTIQAGWATAVGWGWSLLQWIWQGIVQGAVDVWNWFIAMPGNLWGAIQGFWTTATTWGWSLIQWIWQGVVQGAVDVWNWFIAMPGNLWGAIQGVWATAVGWGWQLLAWVLNGINNFEQNIWNWFASLPGWAWDRISAAGQWVIDRGSDFISWIKQGIDNGANAIFQFFSDLPGKAWNFLVALKDNIVGIGSGVIGWVVEGVKSVAGAIWTAISSALTGGATVNGDGTVSVNNLGVTLGGADGGLVGGNFGLLGGAVVSGGVKPNADGGAQWRTGLNGKVVGPGGPRDDLIPSLISNGEYVVNANSTNKYLPLLEQVNADNKFADGGWVQVESEAKDVGAKLGMGYAENKAAQIKAAAAALASVQGGMNLSQDPSSFGWIRGAANQEAYSWNGLSTEVAKGTGGLWTSLLNQLAPSIQGGVEMIDGFQDRNNVNSPGQASFHAYGLAVDVNEQYNPNGASPNRTGKYVIPPGPANSIAPTLGMLWGGAFSGTTDPMHFEIHVSPNQITGGGVNLSAGSAGGGGGGTPISGSFGGGVEQWRATAAQALQILGLAPGFANYILHQMDTESSGNPNAINLTDINAQNGIPSKGLMQVIDPTFRTYALAPYNQNIYDPLSNIIASVRYVLDRYGSIPAGMRGVAYDTGMSAGWWDPGTVGINTSGQKEIVLTQSQFSKFAGSGGGKNVTIATGAIQITVGTATPADREALRIELEQTLREILTNDAERRL